MTDTYIFDAVRTPRGKGRKDGSLHSVTPITLAATALRALRDRNQLDTGCVDDVILGCVSPVGDQGGDIARTAAMVAGYPDTVGGIQINRFCASALEAVNIAGQKIASGWDNMIVAGGIESMSRVPMGSDGAAWAMDPETGEPRDGFEPFETFPDAEEGFEKIIFNGVNFQTMGDFRRPPEYISGAHSLYLRPDGKVFRGGVRDLVNL
jgi:acetyl-CoA acetyltransferase